jgi:hypothetical protein
MLFHLLLVSDWVMDLQYVPQPLDRVGELCGFDGNGHHCHKGLVPVVGIFSPLSSLSYNSFV